jgi:hypothetical protein
MSDHEVTRETIIQRALTDENFKKRLLKDPKKTLRAEYNITIPKGIKLKVFEEDHKHWYLVIPLGCNPSEWEDNGGGVTW